jgi:hypothetical protein
MSKGAQCRKAACQNAGVRIDQSAVEVQKNGASHDPKIAAKSERVQVRLVWFLFRVKWQHAPATGPRLLCPNSGHRLPDEPCPFGANMRHG